MLAAESDTVTGRTMKKNYSKLCWSIHSLREGKNKFHLSLKPTDLDLDYEKTLLAGPVECDVILMRSGAKVILEGEVTFSLALECARCFASFTLKGKEALAAYYYSETKAYNEKDGLSKEDVLGEQYSDDTIDANQLLRDTITLAKPMKPLCSDRCKGLCPICGKNLNTETCTCKKDHSDPRWDPLKKLMKQ